MTRFRLVAFALLCLGAVGCVEGEMTSVVNPDGSAKVRMEVVTCLPLTPFSPGPKKKDDESLDDIRRRAVRPMLESPGVSAWKDVSAEFLPNGRLKFSGIAYVKQLEQFDLKNGAPLLAATHTVMRAEDGSLKLIPKKKEEDGLNTQGRKFKTQDEIKKMTDEELDKYILRELIELQSSKPFLTAMFTDAKLKVTYVLPGDITAATGFERDGPKAFYLVDGNKILATLNKNLNQDQPAWRKLYRSAADHDALLFEVLGWGALTTTATVAKPGKPLFDFDKEVKEARDAYPELRKKFGFGDDLRLPTEDGPPKK